MKDKINKIISIIKKDGILRALKKIQKYIYANYISKINIFSYLYIKINYKKLISELDEILNAKLLENVDKMHNYFVQKLSELKEKYSFIKEIRGLGLMLGIELDISPKEVVNLAFKEGLLILSAGSNVIRFVPPLIIDEKAAEEGFRVLDKVFNEIKGE